MNSLNKFEKNTIFAIGFFSITGFLSAFTLTIDKFEILKNPNKVLNCDINPLLSCSHIMSTPYASVFDIPWSLFGVAGYPAVLLLAFFLYYLYAKVPTVITYLVTLGSFGAFVLSTYFMFISAYLIAVFCPWCVLSAISSTNIFFSLLFLNIKNNNFGLTEKQNQKFSNLKPLHLYTFLFLWFVGIFMMMYLPFYFSDYNINLFLK